MRVYIRMHNSGNSSYWRIIRADDGMVLRSLILTYTDAVQIARNEGWVIIQGGLPCL